LIEINQLKNTNTNFRTEIICMLCSAPFKYIHQLHMFRRTVNELFLIKKKENQEALKILGYYLHKHKYMSETRDDFSSDEDYISAVLRVIRNNYNHYENIIYNIVS
jgi:thermostable 8-oxoguanine DNA glycosylase